MNNERKVKNEINQALFATTKDQHLSKNPKQSEKYLKSSEIEARNVYIATTLFSQGKYIRSSRKTSPLLKSPLHSVLYVQRQNVMKLYGWITRKALYDVT